MALKTTWQFKCVDCDTKNTTDYPPLDNVTHCSKCGFPTSRGRSQMSWEYNDRFYVKKPRGHVWKRDETGDIEIFAYTDGNHHNGPACVNCGYGFCHHCQEAPDCDCTPSPSAAGDADK